jgi:uncharacterized protein
MPGFLVLPGIGNSGPDHWQSRWEDSDKSFNRVEQREWAHPLCRVWVRRLEVAVQLSGPYTILIAHSLACLLVAHWAAESRTQIKAAFLVAVPDPSGPLFPLEARGFSPVPLTKLAFPSIVVASTNDPTVAWNTRKIAQSVGVQS